MKILARGTILESTRKKRGYSLRQLAEITKVNATTLSRIESGVVCPNPKTARGVCSALDLEFDELFELREG